MQMSIRVPARLKRPAPPRMTAVQRQNAARIWEAARIAEKCGAYCLPTPEGFEVRFLHCAKLQYKTIATMAGDIRVPMPERAPEFKLQRIEGDVARGAIIEAGLMGVDPCDWVLYTYTL